MQQTRIITDALGRTWSIKKSNADGSYIAKGITGCKDMVIKIEPKDITAYGLRKAIYQAL